MFLISFKSLVLASVLNIGHVNMATIKQIECMAQAVQFEASAEPVAGKVAVSNVITNRVKSDKFKENTICDVVKNKKQFSFGYSPNKIVIINNKNDLKNIEESISVAYLSVMGLVADNTKGSTYYKNVKIAKDSKWWHTALTPVKVIQNHTFYREKS